MAIFDDNWKSFGCYVIAHIESDCKYGCIEQSPYMGIGAFQFSNWYSWSFLNRCASLYPTETQKDLPLLWNRIKAGSITWGEYIFSWKEVQELTPFLIKPYAIECQNKEFIKILDGYIERLKKDGFKDSKVSMYAMTVIHHSPYTAYNRIKGKVGTTHNDWLKWYNAAYYDRTVGVNSSYGKAFGNRQNKVKSDISAWDGVSGKNGWGTTEPQESNNNDNDPDPDVNYGETIADLGIKFLQRQDDEMILTLKRNGKTSKLIFWQNGFDSWIPRAVKNDFNSDDTKYRNPDTGIDNTPIGGSSDERLNKIVKQMIAWENKIMYCQGRRDEIPICCDCSSLVHWLYNSIGITIGTWTEAQRKDHGKIIMQGGNNQIDISKLQIGDLILVGYNGISTHVELYIGNDVNMGHGGMGGKCDMSLGPKKKKTSTYISYYGASSWWIKRYIQL